MDNDATRQLILDAVDEAYNEFIFYYRKNDKQLPLNAIEKALEEGIISSEEIAEKFNKCLQDSLKVWKRGKQQC